MNRTKLVLGAVCLSGTYPLSRPAPVLYPELETDIHFRVIKTRQPLTKNQKRKMSPRRIKKEEKKVFVVGKQFTIGKHR